MSPFPGLDSKLATSAQVAVGTPIRNHSAALCAAVQTSGARETNDQNGIREQSTGQQVLNVPAPDDEGPDGLKEPVLRPFAIPSLHVPQIGPTRRARGPTPK